MEAILRLRIKELQQEIIDLRKEKVLIYTEIETVGKSIESSTNRNTEILKDNESLLLENNRISCNNTEMELKIATLCKKEADILKGIQNSSKTIKTLDLREGNLISDIVNLNKDITALTECNSQLNKDKLDKKKFLEKIDKSINEKSLILENLNKNVQLVEDRESDLNAKENELIAKDSRLTKKEVRLNDLKKFLVSKK